MTLMTLTTLDLQMDKVLDSQHRHATPAVPDVNLAAGGDYTQRLLLQQLWMSPRPTKRL